MKTYIIETKYGEKDLRRLGIEDVQAIPAAEETLLASLRCDPKARAKFAESPKMLERLVAAVQGAK